jgi:hypothetical protein
MREKLPASKGLAARGTSAVLHGWSVVPPRPAPRALHPLPLPANAAHAEYSDRLLGYGSFGTCISVGVADIERLYDRHRRQATGVRAVRRDSDAAGRLGDGGSVVALSAAEESFAFARGRYLLSSLSGVQELAWLPPPSRASPWL